MFFSNSESEKRGKEIADNLYYFSENQMLDCNQYIIKDPKTNELSLFDAGNGISLNGLLKGMKKLNLDPTNITRVFLTHEHVDHTLGLYPLMKLLINKPPDIYAFGETAQILNEGDVSRIFPGNLGIRPSMFGVEIVSLKTSDLSGIKEIEVSSEYKFQIHYTPGHSLGSISYYDSSNKILIPGDLVFTGGSFGRFDFPGGSLDILINSIKFINDLDVKYLLPGHMGISDNGNQQITLSYKMIQSSTSFY
jgi:glyoxylase-like metal-dependent hydrolase (beta-lactamase superfamily II)